MRLILLFSLLLVTSAATPPATDVVERFHQHFQQNQKLGNLQLLGEELPKELHARMKKHNPNLLWDQLPGQLQRALLYDTGFVLDTTGKPKRIRTTCGVAMKDINIDLSTYTRACSASDNLTKGCPGGFHRQENCDGNALSKVVKCAAEPTGKNINSSMWADDGAPTRLPAPQLVFHSFADWKIMSIHMQVDVDYGSCPESAQVTEPIIPCSVFDGDESKWCWPKQTESLNEWLANTTADGDTSEKSSGWVYGLIAALVVVIGIMGYCIWKRKQRTNEAMTIPLTRTSSKLDEGSAYPTAVTNSRSNDVERNQEIMELQLTGTEIVNANQVNVIKQIGAGAYGEVYLAKYAGVNVAIKKVHSWKSEAAEEFKREIDLLKSLHHPNIIQFLGVTMFRDLGLCSITDFMQRGDLLTVLRDESLNLSWKSEKARISIDSASGLSYLHAFDPPIMHRDLKSRNILVGEFYNAKLADFGLSREVATETMTVAGSNLWLAPEIFRGDRYTEKADIYSMGVVLTEIDTHKLPYHDAVDSNGNKISGVALAHRAAFQDLRPRVSPSCPNPLKALIMKCLASDPDERPGADAFLAELERILQAPETFSGDEVLLSVDMEKTGSYSSVGSLDDSQVK